MAKQLPDVEREAIAIVKTEIVTHDENLVFVTDKVAFEMRELIRRLRKNYWGVFDKPKDPVSGQKKTWIPLSRTLANVARKAIDLDTKDVGFRSVRPSTIGITRFVRQWVREYLDTTFFGERLDAFLTAMTVDGSAVWKTYKTTNGKKKRLEYVFVDNLNLYFDGTADSLQTVFRVTERSLLTVSQVKAMDGWDNTEGIQGVVGLHPSDMYLGAQQTSMTSEYVEVFELWGKIPKWLITGNEEKDKQYIEGHIVCSGVGLKGDPRVHLIEENTNKDKEGNIVRPYEEAHYRKVPGRWLGVGPVEECIELQEWLNLVMNTRIQRNKTASLGILKIKSGAGITQRDLSGLIANGVVRVKDQDDITQLVITESGPASYNDERSALDWARSVTGASEVIQGESLPSTATATATAIQDRNAKQGFALTVDNVGHFLERWIDRHVLPFAASEIKSGDLVKVVGDPDEVRQLLESVARNIVAEEAEKIIGEGRIPTPQEFDQAYQETLTLLSQKKDRFLKAASKIVASDLAAEVVITNEEVNVPVVVQNLVSMLPAVPEQREYLVQQISDLLGIELPSPKPAVQQSSSPGRLLPTTEQEALLAANEQQEVTV